MWCYFHKPIIVLRKILYSIILLDTEKPSIGEKIQYLIKLLLTFAPVAAFMESIGIWFNDNKQFFTGMCIAVLINMVYGYLFHRKAGDFKWKTFWVKNIEMLLIIISVYPLLEIIGSIAGDNLVSETFKIVVQISTILYPGSKALKNAYLFSEKRYPPGFIMERLYKFEKSGNIDDLTGKNDNKE